jgi:hypothetical protein
MSTEEEKPSISKGERLQAKFEEALAQVKAMRLPGWREHVDENKDVGDWMVAQRSKIERAIRDEDEVLYDRAVPGWIKGWEKINIAVAEKYRAENADPELWELRYIKWMKLVYIKFESELGVFYLVPRHPKRRPRAEYWYTVDEMLDMLGNEGIIAAIKTFNQLPVRPQSLEKPKKGEKHMVINLTGDENPKVFYNFHGGLQRG